jgi:hypothetical protein
MPVSNVSLTTSFGSQPSGFGNAGWGLASMSAIGASIPSGSGTQWAIWGLTVTGLPPARAINAIEISGPVSFGVSGSGITRVATLRGEAFKNYTFFNAYGGGQTMATVTGNSQTVNLDYVFTKPGFTSDDLAVGGVFFGIAVATDAANAPNGNGTFTFGATSFTIYTAPDTVGAPPAGAPNAQLISPASNLNPGVFPGGSLAQLTNKLLAPLPQQYYSAGFGVPYNQGFVFVDNGSNSGLIRNQGTVQNPSSPHIAYSGIITVAANTVPGIYTLQGSCTGLNANPQAFYMTTQFRVRDRAQNRLMLSEA